MTKDECDELIKYLNEYVQKYNLCVYPEKQTFDCCDCYLCRVDYFDKIRKELEKN